LQGELDGVYLCLLLLGVQMSIAVGRLNSFKHFIENAVSNTIFMIKEWY
jgi:hypothetical protein